MNVNRKKLERKYVVRRIVAVVVLTALLVSAVIMVNPIGYNHFVRAAGMDSLSMQDPYIEVGNCKLYDGESISYTDGVWTASNGCETEAQEAAGEDAISMLNWSYYRFELTGTTVETPVHTPNLGDGCIFLIGFTTSSGVRLEPGCIGHLLAEEPVSYTLEFLPSFPSAP